LTAVSLTFLIQVLTDIEDVMNEFVRKTQSYISQLAKLQQIYKVHDIPISITTTYGGLNSSTVGEASGLDDSLALQFEDVNLSYKDFRQIAG
jgi:hypothetical protein